MGKESIPEKIEKIERVEKSDAQKLVELEKFYQVDDIQSPEKIKFDRALEKADRDWDATKSKYAIAEASAGTVETPVSVRPIDQLPNSQIVIDKFSAKSSEDLIQRATQTKEELQKPIKAIQETLEALDAKVGQDPEAKKTLDDVYKKIDRTEGPLLTDKLIHINSSINAALSKGGVEVVAPTAAPKDANPLVRFLGYLTHSDREIGKLITNVDALGTSGKPMSPEKIFALQIKISFVQQEIEFFTNVLNKTVESIKTTMNVQI